MKNVKIIPITEEYIEGFNAAVDSVARERKYLAFLEGPSIEMTRDFVLTNIKDNWPHFIAIIDNKIVGWCDITSSNRPVFEHVGILGIGVISDYRGQGIGLALMQTVIQKAKEKGLKRIELTVRAPNTIAKSLYEKLGFKVEGLHKNAVRIGDYYEDLYSMALLLDSDS